MTAHLQQLRVDPAAVVIESIDPRTVTAPVPAVPLVPRTSTYSATMAAKWRTVVVRIVQAITEGGGNWKVTVTLTSAQGEMIETTVLDRSSLTLLRRTFRQGALTFDVAFANGTASGTISNGAQSNTIQSQLGGPIFGDGGGAQAVLATLPLAEGYTTVYRTFNLQKQKAQILRLRVVGSEAVTVPAGTFQAWKAEVASAEGEPGGLTFWVARDTRQVVKVTTPLVQIPGATMTTEVVP